LTVEDHGPGIPAELRERIFEPFFSTKPRDKARGWACLSATASSRTTRELSVESEVGQWTRFHLDLPVE